MVTIRCAGCGRKAEKTASRVNKSKSSGRPLYCGRECFAASRKMTTEEKKKLKAEYDRKYRKKNRARIKANKAAYFRDTYDPVEAAKKRKKTMHKHVEYCRQPEYKKYKREYDRKRRSAKYGEFAGAHSALVALLKEINRQMPDRFERYRQSGRHGWSERTHQKVRERRGNRKRNSIDSI